MAWRRPHAPARRKVAFSASMIFCISASWSCPKPFSASPCRSLARVSGALHNLRNSSSLRKKSGRLPKSISINCCADIGVPSGCQNVVAVMCWMLRSLPSASFTFTFLLQIQGRWPHFGHGSFGHCRETCHTQGTVAAVSLRRRKGAGRISGMALLPPARRPNRDQGN